VQKNAPFALYKGDAADAALLYKNVACNDTLGAKRYISKKNFTQRHRGRKERENSLLLGICQHSRLMIKTKQQPV